MYHISKQKRLDVVNVIAVKVLNLLMWAL